MSEKWSNLDTTFFLLVSLSPADRVALNYFEALHQRVNGHEAMDIQEGVDMMCWHRCWRCKHDVVVAERHGRVRRSKESPTGEARRQERKGQEDERRGEGSEWQPNRSCPHRKKTKGRWQRKGGSTIRCRNTHLYLREQLDKNTTHSDVMLSKIRSYFLLWFQFQFVCPLYSPQCRSKAAAAAVHSRKSVLTGPNWICKLRKRFVCFEYLLVISTSKWGGRSEEGR